MFCNLFGCHFDFFQNTLIYILLMLGMCYSDYTKKKLHAGLENVYLIFLHLGYWISTEGVQMDSAKCYALDLFKRFIRVPTLYNVTLCD